MRLKSTVKNSIAAITLQVIILISGLIIPRLIIEKFGSEVNGLVVSSKQLISYLNYLELGLGGSLIFLLYKPLANNEFDNINALVSKGNKEFKKISHIFLLGVIIISCIYPFIVSSTLSYHTIFL